MGKKERKKALKMTSLALFFSFSELFFLISQEQTVKLVK